MEMLQQALKFLVYSFLLLFAVNVASKNSSDNKKQDQNELLIFSDNLLFTKIENNMTFVGNVKICFQHMFLQTNKVLLKVGQNNKLEKIIIPSNFKATNGDTVIVGKYAEYNAQTFVLKLEKDVFALNKENTVVSQSIIYKTKLNYMQYAK